MEVKTVKKSLAIILGTLFVLSLAANAFAIVAEIPSETQGVVAAGGAQITLSGELSVRGWWVNNIQGTSTLQGGSAQRGLSGTGAINVTHKKDDSIHLETQKKDAK
jgi:hypothetical protein